MHSLELRRYPRCRAEVTFDSEKPVIGVPGEAGAVQPVKDWWGKAVASRLSASVAWSPVTTAGSPRRRRCCPVRLCISCARSDRVWRSKHWQRKLLKGGKNADPFVIARAAVEGGIVVTMEQLKPKAAKIPNICQHFGIQCLTLDEFMEAEGWEF